MKVTKLPSSPWKRPAQTVRSPKKRKAISSLMQYVAERFSMIRYPEFRARHWQIGSGPAAAECKTAASRLKGRGRR